MSVCKHRVSCSISLPSRGSFHLSLTVLISIGHQVVFSLMGWSPLLHTRFLVSRTTLDTTSLTSFFYRTFTFFGLPSQTILFISVSGLCSPLPQICKQFWFGLFLFRSPLLQESSFLSFPTGTEMFQFPAFPSYTLLYSCMDSQVLFPS